MSDPVSRLNAALEGRYRVEREIGKGGMATVYLADDLRHERSVALKVLAPELFAAVGSERFLREIQIAARLRHPHILPLLDSGEADGLLYYTMPHVEGETVRQRLRREKQLPIDEAVHIASQVADALSYSHDHGVIHRDIKPSNIILDSGHAVVADFGIALIVHTIATGRLTASGVSPGSPTYMSPEQAAGDQPLDARSDIYSLGCVLYEMLCGDPPFAGSIPQAVLARKMIEAAPKVRVVRDTVPLHLERVVTRALARTPADRFGSADEFVQALAGDTSALRASDHWPVDAETGAAKGSLSKSSVLLVASLIVAVLTSIGFFATQVYDNMLALPAEYTPSRSDFPLVGLQALVPVLIFAFVAFMAVKYLWRLSNFGARRVPRVRNTLDAWRTATTDAVRKASTALSPTTIADLFFLGATTASVVVLASFHELLLAIVTSNPEPLSCSHRPLHDAYLLTLTLLIMALLFAWHRVFGYLRVRARVTGRIGASRWGSLGWAVILLLMVTMPWRLLYQNAHSRVRVDGERAYILVETEAEFVIYSAETRSTERYRKSVDLNLERLEANGYLFEGPTRFDDGASPQCRG